jgi:hypothetical protein
MNAKYRVADVGAISFLRQCFEISEDVQAQVKNQKTADKESNC